MLIRLRYWLQKHIKMPFQRAVRGYCDYDLWNINCWFLDTMSKMLLRLSKEAVSYPGRGKYIEFEPWAKDLEKYGHMAKRLYDVDYDLRTDDYKNDLEEFLSWFKEYFKELWD